MKKQFIAAFIGLTVTCSQAFASNRFGGDELRSVAEQAPRLFKAIREGLVLAIR